MPKTKRFSKKEWSWIMYDWANSIYATNIMAAIYPTIFASAVEGGDIRWGYATSAATLIVALLAPFLGSLADYKGMKKKLFTAFMLIGVIFTPLMVFTGHWKLCLVGYVISRIGFAGSCLFYDSFLTDVTTDERMDKVSSWGYAMGYIGGSTIPFIISIAMLLIFDYNTFAQTFSVLIVSAWWLVFSIPMLKNVHHEHYREFDGSFSVGAIWSGVKTTFRDICKRKGLLFFVLAYFFYIDGVDTVISISTAYGTTLGLGATGMIIALLVTQIVAMPCSIWFAKLSEKFSARKALTGAVAVYVIICLLGFYMGYTMEPSQDAYNTVFAEAYSEIAVPEELEKDAEELKDEIVSAYKSDDAAEKIAALSLKEDMNEAEASLDAQIKQTLTAAADREKEKVEAFKSAIARSSMLFWVMAVMVGTVQGGIQAVSRSYFGKLIPKQRSNEFYGFFDIFGKFAAFMGTAIYAFVADKTGRSSFGVVSVAVLFAIGMFFLLFGSKEMKRLEQEHIGEA